MSRYPIETEYPLPPGGKGKCTWIDLLSDLVAEKKKSPGKDPSFLIPSEDFTSSLAATRSNIFHAARSCNLKARTRSTNKGLRVWLVGEIT